MSSYRGKKPMVDNNSALSKSKNPVLGAALNRVAKIKYDFKSIDFKNNDANVTMKAFLISAYKGQLVIKMPSIRSGSFGALMLLDSNDKDIETIQHEAGHFVQYREMGVIKYYLGIGIPSFLNGKALNYYDQPWEVTADIYGGVARPYPQLEGDIGEAYFEYLKSLHGLQQWLSFLKAIPHIIKHDMSSVICQEK